MRQRFHAARIPVMLCLTLMLWPQASRAQEFIPLEERVYKKADLPTGGEFVQHPRIKSESYYYTSRNGMWADTSNAQKLAGLYRSTDGGQSWQVIYYKFEFKYLYIHPVTEVLYAIIADKWLTTEQGYLINNYADKAIASSDGKRWKDIMGKQKYLAQLTSIVADPDNPGQVCLYGYTARGVVLQSVDDENSDWTMTPFWIWDEKHPQLQKK